jgi:hypothetical protein
VDADGAPAPERIEVPRGKLVELTLVNDSAAMVRMTGDWEGIEQLVTTGEDQFIGGHSGASLRSVLIDAPGQRTRSVTVRFRRSGTYELSVGRPGAEARTVTVVVS